MEAKENKNLFQKLLSGQLPDMAIDTRVALTQSSLYETAAVLFVTAALVFLAWFAFKKVFK